MKTLINFLFFSMLLGCAKPAQRGEFDPIELSFKPLKQERIKEIMTSDSIDLTGCQVMQIKNHGYDSLFISLFKYYSADWVFESDLCETYQIVYDSLELKDSNIKPFCSHDSIFLLLKGNSMRCIFKGKCKESDFVYRYNFPFKVDSAGIKSFKYLMKFPCDLGLPIKL